MLNHPKELVLRLISSVTFLATHFDTCEIWRKRRKKWYDSAGTAATETRVNVMYPLTETCDYRHVSATVLRVYVKFPFTDSWNFVLWHINFNHVNKIEAGYKVLSLNEQFYAYERPFMYCRDFICERKFYASTHVKITQHLDINP